MPFFDKFPQISYDINRNGYTNYETITDITLRIGILKSVLSNISSYYKYYITDMDTPEILAHKVYKNSEAYWIILYVNDIVDPQYDWPLKSKELTKHLIDKYGSIEYAKTNYHHYEKVIRREVAGVVTTDIVFINATSLTENDIAGQDTYDNLANDIEFQTYTVAGKTVVETIENNRVTFYDWEHERNEAKREIKIIKPEYYLNIMSEFDNLTGVAAAPFMRTL
jgi:hypothetical protein